MLNKKFLCLVDGIFTDATGYNDAIRQVTNAVGQGKVSKAFVIVEVAAEASDTGAGSANLK